jgi:hypothetical protein
VVADYVGVLQNLQKALAIYAATRGGDTPVHNKDGLVSKLEEEAPAKRGPSARTTAWTSTPSSPLRSSPASS